MTGLVRSLQGRQFRRLFLSFFGEYMFSHVMVGTNDLDASRKFYDAALGALGINPGALNRDTRCFYRSPTGVFAVTLPLDNKPATAANGGTIGFAAQSTEQVDAFHAAGVANGGVTCEDPPGYREGPAGKMYLAYLRDPAGNKICAMFRAPK